MKFLEKDLEDIIFNAPEGKLTERGLYFKGKKQRQLEIGNYGIADIVTMERPRYDAEMKVLCKGMISVFELKKDGIGIDAFLQGVRYTRGIQRYLEKKHPKIANSFDYRIVLVGSSIDHSYGFPFLANMFGGSLIKRPYTDEPRVLVRLVEYRYDYDGIGFYMRTDFIKMNEGF